VVGEVTLDLFGDVHPAEPESLCDGATHWSFAVQNHIDQNAIKAVALRKNDLTSPRAQLQPSANEQRHLRQTQVHGGPHCWQSGHLTYCALPWRIPNARFSQFRNRGKANEADYLYVVVGAILAWWLRSVKPKAQDLIPVLRRANRFSISLWYSHGSDL
jgi:hypothetical protein